MPALIGGSRIASTKLYIYVGRRSPPRLELHLLPFAEKYVLFSPVGFKGNLSLLEIFSSFPGVSTVWKFIVPF